MFQTTADAAITLLDLRGVDRIRPTIAQLSRLLPHEWILVLDAIIDRALPSELNEALEILLTTATNHAWIVRHRWMERQMQSMEKLPPLLPWFIRSRPAPTPATEPVAADSHDDHLLALAEHEGMIAPADDLGEL